MKEDLKHYKTLLHDIKQRVRQGQLRASLSANAEMLAAYWDIGRMIHELQQKEGLGARVIPRLANDLKNELSGIKGFSARNIARMVSFHLEYNGIAFLSPLVAKSIEVPSQNENNIQSSILPPAVAKLQEAEFLSKDFYSIPWTHHIILLDKIKDISTRCWYMKHVVINGWSKETLLEMIKTSVYQRQGNAVTNFDTTLPPLQSLLAKEMLKDPYIFDFTTLATEYTERELEGQLIKHVQKFLLELGAGFSFVGRQYKIEISDRDFYIDLLFYHLKMRCFVVIDLKKGEFIPEYAGKMNFYCSAVDDILKHETDTPSIGLILCQGKDKLFAEYALKDINKPIGISEYKLTRLLPKNLKSSLPSIQDIEYELNEKLGLNIENPGEDK